MWDWLTALVWTCRILAVTGVVLLFFAPDFAWPPGAVMVPVILVGAIVWVVAEIFHYRHRHPRY